MAFCDDYKNPLTRGGTSQLERHLPGLTPGYVDIDERDYSDWIVFAAEFSKYVTFYDSHTGNATNTWQPFFNQDVSAVLGSIAVQNIETYRLMVKERFNFLKDNRNATSTEALKTNLSELFSAVFTLSKSLDAYTNRLGDDVAFKLTLVNLIKNKLSPALIRLSAYVKGADKLGFYKNVTSNTWRILNLPLIDAKSIQDDRHAFSNLWLSFDGVEADESIFGEAIDGETDAERSFQMISHAANHFLFASIFDQFTGAFSRLIVDAEKALSITLENYPEHAPHYTLFLAFLKLFKISQRHLNGVTERHLDFYYKEVLRVKPKPAIPNTVHLIAELAKPVQQAVLPSGTLFKAGKDSLGKDVVYSLDKETSFNKAEVALFKAVYHEHRLFASPVMNSADGQGAAIKTTLKEWHPFVNKGLHGEINMPLAEVGFAIASHYLFLAEGQRTVRIKIDHPQISALSATMLTCYLTTEKNWFEASDISVNASVLEQSPCAEIVVTIPPAAPSITAHQAKIHGGNFNVDVPVLKIMLRNDVRDSAYAYETLKQIAISKIQLVVEVGTTQGDDGLKRLSVSNQNNRIDTSKPFQPWGPAPEKEMALIIGSHELFSKQNVSFNVNVSWANRPSPYNRTHGVDLEFLAGGNWRKLHEGPGDNLNPVRVCTAVSETIIIGDVPAKFLLDYKERSFNYNAASNAGFFRIVLLEDFGHRAYSVALRDHLIRKALKENTTEPVEPYTPVIKSLAILYAAHSPVVRLQENREGTEQQVRFFHVGPFGEAAQPALRTGTPQYLLPPFKSRSSDGEIDNIAEWYIGMKNLLPGQAVNILFQFLEGSTDPRVSKPEKHVFWSYLSHNVWKSFDAPYFDDATRQLVQSGIISFSIPEDATIDNSLFPAGYIWLKAGIASAPQAICKVLSVTAQAMSATYLPLNNAPDFLDSPLPPGTITKLKEPNASFKKITQPYASFGGRQAESNRQFYLRTSERLRHKGRAITIWDYERLVLEAYPQLYKVKCLNHTRIQDDGNNASIYHENQPGHVAIITIPDLTNRNEVNPLKPYTNQRLLREILEFLRQRVSQQVQVHVCNPVFEEVLVRFTLKLKSGYDDVAFYRQLLQNEITQYLSPWTFSNQVDLQFGGKIYKSSIINFIEERPYVDFITDVQMFHKPEEASPISDDLEEIQATTARSVLVSALASEHQIFVSNE
jgi:hypothetical protein